MQPTLNTARLTVEHMAPGHAVALADFFRRNERHLAPWDPPRPAGIMESEFWQAECERAVEDYENGAVVRWVLCLRGDPHRVIGRVNYTQIARGPFQSCMLGYAVDAALEGRGLMHEALEATIEHIFTVLLLHRIQASHVPENERSARLLERLGFVREGLAKNYLYINGAWRDHVLTARLNPAFDTSIFTPRPFRPA
ncbi:MAG: GNAT family N-acetyltransferase [Burkholderiaceae bacterium]